MPFYKRCFYSLVGIVLCGVAPVLLAAPGIAFPEMLEDAELAAVHFVDADRGWAVGDRGVIWATTDGGRNWSTQLSPTASRLSAVHFVDAETGWAVGGFTQPYTHRTTGIVLRTRDGGLSWTASTDQTLPALRWVKFIDKQRGWAAGDSSAMYPTGLFWTSDAGRSWLPVPRGPAVSWQAGELAADGMPLLMSADGRIGRASYQEVRLTASKSSYPLLQSMRLNAFGEGIQVGASGLVKSTSDFGVSWQSSAAKLPAMVNRIDFRASAMLGKRIWLVGEPGSVILRSSDAGQTWETFLTENATPLHAIHFLDENRGWAVGSLGVILATRDGGRSWLTQRRGGKQAALFGVFSEPARIPWEWFAQYSGNDSYLSALEIIGQRALHPQRLHNQTTQTHEAFVAVGGCNASTAWQFPLLSEREQPRTEAILRQWNEFHHDRALPALEERLVRRLRMWRPEVVFTEDVSPRGDDPQGHLLNQAVLAAVQQASDPTIYPEHTTELGLLAWKVKKVVTHLASERRGALTLSTSQLAPRLGKSLAEAAEAGRSLLTHRQQVPPVMLSASILVDSLPQGVGRQELFGGISIRPGGDARRKLSDAIGGSLESLTRLTQKRHNLQQLIARTAGDSQQAANWLSQVTELTQGMSELAAGEVLFQLGNRYQQTGKLELAADAFVALVEHNPQHPLADPAALWLIQYYSSCEVAWRLQGEQKYDVQLARFESNVAPPLPDEEENKKTVRVPNTSLPKIEDLGNPPAAKTLRMQERAAKALAIAKQLERTRPAFYAEPAVKLPFVVAQRHANLSKPNERPLENLLNLGSYHPLATAIAAENWFPAMRGNSQKFITISRAVKPPVLNGRLDDEVWQSSRTVKLEPLSERDSAVSRVVFAYDDDYLYLAASCSRVAGIDYPADQKARLHDAMPPQTDRLQFTFDLDRDYATGFQLVIDYAGRLGENCMGDTTWNPRWFVAAAGDESYWTIEAAIPREELTPVAPKAKDAWNIAIERSIPKQGKQTLYPVDTDGEYRLLLFE